MKKNKKFFFAIEAFFLFLAAVSFTNFSGCSDSVTNSTGTVTPTRQAMVERQFALSSSLKAEAGAVIVVDLEDLNSPSSPEDTGPIGEDVIPYNYASTAEHRFEIGSSSNFKMKLVSDLTGTTLFELDPNSFIVVTIPAGSYKMHLISLETYSASDSASNVIFIQRNSETAFTSSLGGGYNPNDLNTFLQTRKCYQCDLNNADLSKMNLRKIQLTFCFMRIVDLHQSDLTDSDCADNEFINSNFTGANLTNVDFSGRQGRKFFMANNMSKVKAIGTKFTNLEFYAVDIDSGFFSRCDFSGDIIRKISFTNSKVTGVKFDSAYFTDADNSLQASNTDFYLSTFRYARIPSAELDKCNLGTTNFSNASLNNSIIKNSNLSANFRNAKLSNSSIIYSDLFSADFRDADISNLNISFSSIVGANFCGAKMFNMSSSFVYYDATTKCWP